MVTMLAEPHPLPGAKRQAAVSHRKRQLRAEQAGADMAGHVPYTAEMDSVWTPVPPMVAGQGDFLAVHIGAFGHGHRELSFVHISVRLHGGSS